MYENSNQPARALDAYHKAIEVDPKYWRNYQDLGTFYFYRDAYDEAIQQYKKLVEVAPDLAASHYALAAPYLNLGRYADAEYELNTALGLQEFPNAREGLGLSLVYQGRDREAVPLSVDDLRRTHDEKGPVVPAADHDGIGHWRIDWDQDTLRFFRPAGGLTGAYCGDCCS